MYTHSLQNTYIIWSSDTCCTHAYASSCKALLGVIWQNCMPQECWPNPGAQKADFMLVGSCIRNAVPQECWPNLGAQKADSTLVRSYITNSLYLKNFNQIQVHRKQIPWTTSIMWPAEWELGFAGMYQVVGVAEWRCSGCCEMQNTCITDSKGTDLRGPMSSIAAARPFRSSNLKWRQPCHSSRCCINT